MIFLITFFDKDIFEDFVLIFVILVDLYLVDSLKFGFFFFLSTEESDNGHRENGLLTSKT